MQDMYGLIELTLVFGLVLGLGVFELYRLRRDTRRAEAKARKGKDLTSQA